MMMSQSTGLPSSSQSTSTAAMDLTEIHFVPSLASDFDDEETVVSSNCSSTTICSLASSTADGGGGSGSSDLMAVAEKAENAGSLADISGAASADSLSPDGFSRADSSGVLQSTYGAAMADSRIKESSILTTSSSRSGRTLRRCRQDSETTVCCPVCKLPLRSTDVTNHVEIEIDRLSKISASSRYRKSGVVVPSETSPRKKAFLRIQKNRQARLRAKMRRGDDTLVDYTSCPVCNELINGTPEELNEHVELCLHKVQRTNEDQDVDIDNSDDDDDESFEEYEWAGQTRVRASSMLLRVPAAVTASTAADDAVDLDIEDDDSTTYGQSHRYSEADLLMLGLDEPDEDKKRHVLRKAVLGGDASSLRSATSDGKWNQDVSDVDSAKSSSLVPKTLENNNPSSSSSSANLSVFGVSPSAIVQSLRMKIAELEQQLQSTNIPRCLICMETYTKPLTSIQCWHVHCEECWLRTLGAKKLCPQCNMITSPVQLRRIYL